MTRALVARKRKIFALFFALAASIGLSWGAANSITINGTPQVGDNSISLTYYFDPGNVSGFNKSLAPTLKVKCVTDNNWDEKWLSAVEISSGTENITLNTLGSFKAGKEYAICFAYNNGSWVDEVFQSFSFPAAPTKSITINGSSYGSVVASPTSAEAGATITLTATPDEGYQLKSISGVYEVQATLSETLNSTAETVNGNKFRAQATSYNNYGWRVYNPGSANTLTISSKDGATLIEKIELTSTWGKSRGNNMLSVSAGTLSFDGSNPSTTVTINNINATSVTINGSGTNAGTTWCISSAKIYYTGTIEKELEISDTENANVKTFTMVDSEVTISAEFEAAAPATSGSCGDNLTWEFNTETGALTISGTGAMNDYSWDPNSAPWYAHKDAITSVSFPEGITTIGAYAFVSCDNAAFTTVTIPEGVTALGVNAFYNCDGIQEITIPSTVTTIQTGAIYDCKAVNSITSYIASPTNLHGYAIYGYKNTCTLYVPYGSIDAYKAADCWKSIPNIAAIPGTLTPEGVAALIDAIGEVAYTAECKAKIDEARAAYNALSDEKKAQITNYEALTTAEATYAGLLAAAQEKADAVVVKIDAIPATIEFTEACGNAIEAARKAYDALTDAEKALVPAEKLTVLTDAEVAYKLAAPTIDLSILTADYEVGDGKTLTGTLANNVRITIAPGATVTLSNVNINGDNTWTGGDYAGITCPGDATIILADGTVNKIRGFLNGNAALHIKPDYTLTIEGNGTLYASTNGGASAIGCGYSDQSGSRNGGNIVINGGTIYATGGSLGSGIGGGGRAKIGNITINGGIIFATGGGTGAGIGGGQSKNNSWKSECGNITISSSVKYLNATKGSGAAHSVGKGSSSYSVCGTLSVGGNTTELISTSPYIYCPPADAVEVLIDAIGTLAYTPECKAKIDAAREAYDALEIQEMKDAVENYATLTAAEEAYASATDEIALINAIPNPVEFTDACKEAIDAARAAYDAMTEAGKALVTNYATLTDAESKYAVDKTKALINALPDTPLADEDKKLSEYNKVTDAREAYDALSAADKTAVDNYDKLTAAEAAFAAIGGGGGVPTVVVIYKSEFTSTGVTKEGVNLALSNGSMTADDMLAMDGSFEFSTSLGKFTNITIETDVNIMNISEGAYTSAGWPTGTNLGTSAAWTGNSESVLIDCMVAGNAITITCTVAPASVIADAQAAKDLIDAIPSPVVYTPECKEAIKAAREALDALSDEAKALFNEADTAALPAAETAYAGLLAEKVAPVIAAIDAVPATPLTDATKKLSEYNKVTDARALYDALSDEEKAAVTNYDKLTAAEAAFAAISGGTPAGALSGAFTINEEGDRILFSKGNLQATTTDNGTTWTWSFAANQWNTIGNAVANTAISGNGTVSENGTVDLFGWSTTTNYYGINNSMDEYDYSGDFVDWGATMGAGWRTLTSDEWKHLLSNRTMQSSAIRYVNSTVNNIKGLIILPDDWDESYYTLTSGYFGENIISAADWTDKLEAHGAVFLPVTGYRSGTDCLLDEGGYYSTPTLSTSYSGYTENMNFDGSSWTTSGDMSVSDGLSVRLVTAAATPSPLADAQAVKDLINAIPQPVVYTPECSAAIKAAREALDALGENASLLDDADLQKLTDAEDAYADLLKEKVAPVIAAINALPDTPLADEDKKLSEYNKVTDARALYDALTDEEKAAVTNYDKLTAAEEAFAAINNGGGTIYDSGSVALTDLKVGDILKGGVSLTGEATDKVGLQSLAQNGEKKDGAFILSFEYMTPLLGENAAVTSGSMVFTPIAEDGNAGDAWIVFDGSALTEATVWLKGINSAALPSVLADAQAAVDLINAIPQPVAYTPECSAAIKAAREAVDALGENASLLDDADLQKLTDAEAAYADLLKEKVAPVIAAIDAIPSPIEDNLKLSAYDKVTDARALYDALTDEEKAAVDNYSKLTDAEAAFAAINKGAGTVYDSGSVALTDLKVGDILKGGVTLIGEASDKIGTLRVAMNGEKKEGVFYILPFEHMNPLLGENAAISHGPNVFSPIAEDGNAGDAWIVTDGSNQATVWLRGISTAALPSIFADAQAAVDLIPDPVVLSDECKAKIDAAREAVTALGENASLIDDADIDKLAKAEADFALLIKDATAVVAKIDAIGDVTFSAECKEKIVDARNAYEELADELKPYVTNLTKLTDAEAAYEAARPFAPVTTVPAAVEALQYTGAAQTLITAGAVEHGTILYSLDGVDYSTELPTALLPGAYTVYYKVQATDDYKDVAPTTFIATIAYNYPATYGLFGIPEGWSVKVNDEEVAVVNGAVKNIAANDRFDIMPVKPEDVKLVEIVPYLLDLATATDSVIYLMNGDSITGTANGNISIVIVPDAKVYFKDVNLTNTGSHPAVLCGGNAEMVVVGENTITCTTEGEYGIRTAGSGTTLTISGDKTLLNATIDPNGGTVNQ